LRFVNSEERRIADSFFAVASCRGDGGGFTGPGCVDGFGGAHVAAGAGAGGPGFGIWRSGFCGFTTIGPGTATWCVQGLAVGGGDAPPVGVAVGVGVGVGVGDGVIVGVGVGVGDGVIVGVGVGDGVIDGVIVGVGVGDGVIDGVIVGVGDGLGDGERDGVGDGVGCFGVGVGGDGGLP